MGRKSRLIHPSSDIDGSIAALASPPAPGEQRHAFWQSFSDVKIEQEFWRFGCDRERRSCMVSAAVLVIFNGILIVIDILAPHISTPPQPWYAPHLLLLSASALALAAAAVRNRYAQTSATAFLLVSSSFVCPLWYVVWYPDRQGAASAASFEFLLHSAAALMAFPCPLRAATALAVASIAGLVAGATASMIVQGDTSRYQWGLALSEHAAVLTCGIVYARLRQRMLRRLFVLKRGRAEGVGGCGWAWLEAGLAGKGGVGALASDHVGGGSKSIDVSGRTTPAPYDPKGDPISKPGVLPQMWENSKEQAYSRALCRLHVKAHIAVMAVLAALYFFTAVMDHLDRLRYQLTLPPDAAPPVPDNADHIVAELIPATSVPLVSIALTILCRRSGSITLMQPLAIVTYAALAAALLLVPTDPYQINSADPLVQPKSTSTFMVAMLACSQTLFVSARGFVAWAGAVVFLTLARCPLAEGWGTIGASAVPWYTAAWTTGILVALVAHVRNTELMEREWFEEHTAAREARRAKRAQEGAAIEEASAGRLGDRDPSTNRSLRREIAVGMEGRGVSKGPVGGVEQPLTERSDEDEGDDDDNQSKAPGAEEEAEARRHLKGKGKCLDIGESDSHPLDKDMDDESVGAIAGTSSEEEQEDDEEEVPDVSVHALYFQTTVSGRQTNRLQNVPTWAGSWNGQRNGADPSRGGPDSGNGSSSGAHVAFRNVPPAPGQNKGSTSSDGTESDDNDEDDRAGDVAEEVDALLSEGEEEGIESRTVGVSTKEEDEVAASAAELEDILQEVTGDDREPPRLPFSASAPELRTTSNSASNAGLAAALGTDSEAAPVVATEAGHNATPPHVTVASSTKSLTGDPTNMPATPAPGLGSRQQGASAPQLQLDGLDSAPDPVARSISEAGILRGMVAKETRLSLPLIAVPSKRELRAGSKAASKAGSKATSKVASTAGSKATSKAPSRAPSKAPSVARSRASSRAPSVAPSITPSTDSFFSPSIAGSENHLTHNTKPPSKSMTRKSSRGPTREASQASMAVPHAMGTEGTTDDGGVVRANRRWSDTVGAERYAAADSPAALPPQAPAPSTGSESPERPATADVGVALVESGRVPTPPDAFRSSASWRGAAAEPSAPSSRRSSNAQLHEVPQVEVPPPPSPSPDPSPKSPAPPPTPSPAPPSQTPTPPSTSVPPRPSGLAGSRTLRSSYATPPTSAAVQRRKLVGPISLDSSTSLGPSQPASTRGSAHPSLTMLVRPNQTSRGPSTHPSLTMLVSVGLDPAQSPDASTTVSANGTASPRQVTSAAPPNIGASQRARRQLPSIQSSRSGAAASASRSSLHLRSTLGQDDDAYVREGMEDQSTVEEE
ncbi:hypothetical protein BDK51DRAFT_38325 [Blyttiomyces helicus]|uniref:Uncharacterized protein n=1 Tax=Blyttiomyces helicus TaxID=388810 RepID=A0A4V1ISR5_9FUNG|nr:hypothetical protein BDK51DRAFT_38325 [Blyttiomyces helicus]|eukprot:RKO94477.1 hypothetical protein BDK51DRAFT_38325 [Blyttiomyces helicus]